ncbi:high affinity cAMP-specific and IBMX-insensitive 3',5'-cyclic phosphodiesterase 8B-like isoform X2 [Eriocheir sinensis]|uniref:high affinity cAMP-specific and IBMX-insensitive 3',5'-cyclic phosphodiesterase 8B-like isoform X2 n=1 Tax=Eriocheir sinensis TaxID=95602 RepID=UPI0021C91918|nr:high affinity cAMP-specific and IBMX-insensitive 3',5'-cyclic phosphodiesterase 8B-like isoform X2 [Eriocheir sinensis]
MGCAPSLHVSDAGVLSCREEEEEEEVHTNANHQPTSTATSTTTTTTTTTTTVLSAAYNQRQGPRGQQQVSQSWEVPVHPLRLVTVPPPPPPPPLDKMRGQTHTHLKVLLVFSREDSVCCAWKTASNRQGHHITITHTQEQAVCAYGEQTHDLVVIDARTARGYQAGGICSALRQCDGGQLAVCVGVVKRSFADKENATVGPLLKAGFNRILTETSSVGAILNELVQLETSEIASQVQVCASQAVLCALDTCRELVHITDAHHRIKYINKATENVLGYSLEEVVDKNLWEIHTPHSTSSTSAANTTTSSSAATDHHRPSLEFRQPLQPDHLTTANLKNVDGKMGSDIPEPVHQAVRRGREWEGLVACRRRSGGTLHLPSKVIPVGPLARRNQFYVYLSDTHTPDAHPLDLHHFHHHHHHPRGSIKSLRKGSHSHDLRALTADGGGGNIGPNTGGTNAQTGGIIRRQSLVKLHSLTIEAPITRVFSIIAAAQDNSPAYVAQALEKAVEILRSTELYSPQLVPTVGGGGGSVGGGGDGMAGVRAMVPAADPVATDLLGGLLAQGPKPLLSGRRSSNDTAVSVGSAGGGKVTQPPAALARPSLPALNQQASSGIRELLAGDMMWNFDIFKLERISDKKPLVWLGMSLMCKFDVPATLGCDETTLQNWLTLIEANYHLDNSYHNSTHAADVLQSTAYFVNKERLRHLLDPLDVAAALVAAVVHDVDHPGKNSAFLCNTNNELAVLYNDLSVLESHHVAVSFKHTRSDDRVNIFKALDRDTYKHVRKSVIDMVLATDMTRHFEHLSKFINMAGAASTSISASAAGVESGDSGDDCGGGGGGAEGSNGVFEEDGLGQHADLLAFGSPENLVIIKRMLIKCADVSNPLRPLPLSIDWAYRIANEYFNQTEEEKERSLPIVMPQFDRTTCSIPKSQIGFIDFFINDMFDAWDALADIPELLEHLRSNYLYWKEQEEAGITAPPPQPPQPQPPPPPTPPPPNGEKIDAQEEEEEEMIKEEEEEEEKKEEEEEEEEEEEKS